MLDTVHTASRSPRLTSSAPVRPDDDSSRQRPLADDGRVHLLPRALLIKTGAVDEADWNYRPMLGRISRRRFGMVKALLGATRSQRLLEIGYGSGIFLPELARHCEELYGIDVHPLHERVAASLATLGIHARLSSATTTAMPFPDAFFDIVVAVSVLEFVVDLDAGLREIARVLRPQGVLIVVTPGYSRIADLGLRLLTGKRAKDDFHNRRERIIPTVAAHFAIDRRLVLPPVGSSLLTLYTALRARVGE
jgi:SAM-dependent methyltransferase